jgi:hypothetical protein
MTMVESSGRVQLVDKWSWLVAMSITIALFTVSLLATLDPQFSAVAAAGAGIGVQFFLPYHARLSAVAATESASEDGDGAGGLHQGAAGGSVFVASVIAVIVMIAAANSTTALLAGGAVLVVVYAVLAAVLEPIPVSDL